ncbi:ComZ family protein [Alkalihalobacillus sp. AL-G]|uniref:ComZ family protein n=1 Tax=Alkalihalobacillus sp. AL-G TaxID=2926399 RepID=UPI002729DC14|nr:ComZ family protein [Alkalihalobacillus sp. AL-G]WLD94903.1 ComZ family protein [Alkalihalobacillus sp. AL-G]
MDQERNMKFMQIAMAHLPEAKQMMEQKGVEFSMEDIQPMLNMLMNVMNDAYELGKEEAGE